MGTFEWRQGRIRLGQESNWRICLDENQFRSTRPRERLLWLPDNRITDYDDEDDYNKDKDGEDDEDDEDNKDDEDNEDKDDDGENQFSPTRERLLWLPHNHIIVSDEHLMFLFLDVMLGLTTMLLNEE